jgi:N-acylglucosamine-6-phosphate 2-epimerase
MKIPEFTQLFPRGLIVSCQAPEGDLFDDTRMLVEFAKAAKVGGAVGLRANGPEVIAAMHAAVALPIIGIYKRPVAGERVFITPTFAEAEAVARAGSACVAIEVSERSYPGRPPLAELFRRIHEELGCCIMADISNDKQAAEAASAGADVIGTTLSGYTPESPKLDGPDLELVGRLARTLDRPVVAEGRYHSPELAAEAIRAGAWAVVVGEGITKPQKITERYARAVGAARSA